MPDKFNAVEFAAQKATEFRAQQKAEEVVEAPQETPVEPEPTEPEIAVEQPPVAQDDSEVVAALKRELARVKEANREKKSLAELSTPKVENEDYSKAEVLLFTAWREEALEEFKKEHPEYESDSRKMERFVEEYEERLPDLEYAKRNKLPVTKSFFRKRFDRVHRSIDDVSGNAKEEGKKEVLKTMSQASVMKAGSSGGSEQPPSAGVKKVETYQRPSTSFSSWLKK